MINKILNSKALKQVSGGVNWQSIKNHPIKTTLITLGSFLTADLVVAIIRLGVGICGESYIESQKAFKYGYRIFDVCTLTLGLRLVAKSYQKAQAMKTFKEAYDEIHEEIWTDKHVKFTSERIREGVANFLRQCN